MLAGEIRFYNRYSKEILHRIDMDEIDDIEKYQHSREFYKIIFQSRIGRVTTSIHYTNGAPIETTIFENDLSGFSDVSVEEDTRIINMTNVKIEGIEARYESWVWDGILGESLIFHNEAVEHLSDQELELLIEKIIVIEDPRRNVKRMDKYTFVNFNFCVPC
jgi:hypothetical protein